LAPIAAKAECRGGAGDEREAESAESAGITFLIDGLEGGKALAEQPAKRIRAARPIHGLDALSGGGCACRLHME
jgi:hypothetical protein